MKDIAAAKVEAFYGFKAGLKPETINDNKLLAEKLLMPQDKPCFMHRVRIIIHASRQSLSFTVGTVQLCCDSKPFPVASY